MYRKSGRLYIPPALKWFLALEISTKSQLWRNSLCLNLFSHRSSPLMLTTVILACQIRDKVFSMLVSPQLSFFIMYLKGKKTLKNLVRELFFYLKGAFSLTTTLPHIGLQCERLSPVSIEGSNHILHSFTIFRILGRMYIFLGRMLIKQGRLYIKTGRMYLPLRSDVSLPSEC